MAAELGSNQSLRIGVFTADMINLKRESAHANPSDRIMTAFVRVVAEMTRDFANRDRPGFAGQRSAR